MATLHASLNPRYNTLFIYLWGVGSILFGLPLKPQPQAALIFLGCLAGFVIGWMQHLSISEAAHEFVGPSSLLEIRRVFKSTNWGRRSIAWLYLSKLLLALLSILLVRKPLSHILCGYLVAYFALMFVRDIVTLRDTRRLAKLARLTAGQSSPVS